MSTASEHECPTCGRSCASYSGLGTHHKAAHGESIVEYEAKIGEYECSEPECELAFDSETSLQMHIGHSHGGTSVEVECSQCGVTVERSRPKAEMHDTFLCGDKQCRSEWSSARTGSDAPNWRGGPAKFVCYHCGETKKRSWSNVNESGENFCDMECLRGHWNTTRTEVECHYCGDTVELAQWQLREYSSERKFCRDSDCMEQWQSEYLSGENSPLWKDNRIKVECSWCGDPKEVLPWFYEHHDRHYCDWECKCAWQRENADVEDLGFEPGLSGPDHPNWKGGTGDVYRAVRATVPGTWLSARKRARERADRCCEVCGSDESVDNWELDVHHIVPLMAGGTNGDWNTVALCRHCHIAAEHWTSGLFEWPFTDWSDEELPDGRLSSREYMARVADPPAGQATFAAFADD